jgi:hypothetical protein
MINFFNKIKNKIMKKKVTKNDLKKGTHIRVIANTNGNDYGIGQTYVVDHISSTDCCVCISLDGSFEGNNLKFCDLEIVGLDIEHYQEANKTLTAQIAENESIIEWMKETGNKTYNPNEHKVWKTLSLLENDKLSKGEKAKIIASLIN